jgi:hypothetical protein
MSHLIVLHDGFNANHRTAITPCRGGRRVAFTLVEVLVTFFILTLLAGIALPVTRNVIRDQRNNRASQLVLSFLDSTRNNAIASDREMGVMFERLDPQGFGRSVCLRLRQLKGVPDYTGDSAKAEAELIYSADFPGAPGLVNAAKFNSLDSHLVCLSADMLATNVNDSASPIRPGDQLELPGGRLATIRALSRPGIVTAPDRELHPAYIHFQLNEPLDPANPGHASGFPHRPLRVTTPPHRVKYAIHRSPVISNSRTVSLPRGTAIDFNYSGFGVRGSEFMPADLDDPSIPAAPVVVMFDSKGRISRVQQGNVSRPPASQLFFCLGDLDGVQADTANILNEERRTRANVLRTNATWIVLNPASGRIAAAPMAPVETQMAIAAVNPLESAIQQARFLALVGDTLE